MNNNKNNESHHCTYFLHFISSDLSDDNIPVMTNNHSPSSHLATLQKHPRSRLTTTPSPYQKSRSYTPDSVASLSPRPSPVGSRPSTSPPMPPLFMPGYHNMTGLRYPTTTPPHPEGEIPLNLTKPRSSPSGHHSDGARSSSPGSIPDHNLHPSMVHHHMAQSLLSAAQQHEVMKSFGAHAQFVPNHYGHIPHTMALGNAAAAQSIQAQAQSQAAAFAAATKMTQSVYAEKVSIIFIIIRK